MCGQPMPIVAIVMPGFFQIERAVLKRMQKWDGMFAGDRKWIRVTEA